MDPHTATPRKALKILVPTDFSAYAGGALRYASKLARASGAEICLMHVCSPQSGESQEEREADFAAADLIANRAIEQIRDFGVAASVRISNRVEFGDVPSAILSVATSQNVDLIVMGKKGASRSPFLAEGHVTEVVGNHAPCPVIKIQVPLAEPTALDELDTRPVAATGEYPLLVNEDPT